MKSIVFDSANNLSADSLHAVGTFFQKQPVVVRPQLLHVVSHEWIFYVLFGLLFLIAFIRFYYPAAIKPVFFWFSAAGFRKGDSNSNKYGLWVSSFLLLNFIVSFTILIFAFHFKVLDDFSSLQFWLYVAGAIAGFFVYNQLAAFLIGFIFDTGNQASVQMKNNAFWAFVSGLFLTPFLLLYYYSDSPIIFNIMIGGLIIFLFFKWFQTAKTGLSTRNFNALHLFLYLCAVEIVPLFLLVKVFVK